MGRALRGPVLPRAPAILRFPSRHLLLEDEPVLGIEVALWKRRVRLLAFLAPASRHSGRGEDGRRAAVRSKHRNHDCAPAGLGPCLPRGSSGTICALPARPTTSMPLTATHTSWITRARITWTIWPVLVMLVGAVLLELPMLACLVPFARWPRPVTCTGRTVGRPVGW